MSAHYVGLQAIEESIDRLNFSIKILDKDFSGKISHEDNEKINKSKRSFAELSRNKFVFVIIDAHYVEKFSIQYKRSDGGGG